MVLIHEKNCTILFPAKLPEQIIQGAYPSVLILQRIRLLVGLLREKFNQLFEAVQQNAFLTWLT